MHKGSIYRLLQPLTSKYGEDIVQDALVWTLEHKPALLDAAGDSLVKLLTIASKHIKIDQNRAREAELIRISEVYAVDAQAYSPEKHLALQEYWESVQEIWMMPVSERRKYQLLDRCRQEYIV